MSGQDAGKTPADQSDARSTLCLCLERRCHAHAGILQFTHASLDDNAKMFSHYNDGIAFWKDIACTARGDPCLVCESI
jgi:hypothetical protein